MSAGSRRPRVQPWRWRTSPFWASRRGVRREPSCSRSEPSVIQNLCFLPAAVFNPLSRLQALDRLKGKTEEIPCVVGDEHVWTGDVRYQLSVRTEIRSQRRCQCRVGWVTSLCFSLKPFNHSHKVAKFCYADKVSGVCLFITWHASWFLSHGQRRASNITAFEQLSP